MNTESNFQRKGKPRRAKEISIDLSLTAPIDENKTLYVIVLYANSISLK